MIFIDLLPCKRCKFFKGVLQPDNTEKTEYAGCKKADSGASSELIELENKKMICNFFEKADDNLDD